MARPACWPNQDMHMDVAESQRPRRYMSFARVSLEKTLNLEAHGP